MGRFDDGFGLLGRNVGDLLGNAVRFGWGFLGSGTVTARILATTVIMLAAAMLRRGGAALPHAQENFREAETPTTQFLRILVVDEIDPLLPQLAGEELPCLLGNFANIERSIRWTIRTRASIGGRSLVPFRPALVLSPGVVRLGSLFRGGERAAGHPAGGATAGDSRCPEGRDPRFQCRWLTRRAPYFPVPRRPPTAQRRGWARPADA